MNAFPIPAGGARPLFGARQWQEAPFEAPHAGRLRIGVDGSVMAGAVPTLLRQLHTDFPALRWSLHEANALAQFSALCERKIDVGIWRGHPNDAALLLRNHLCQQLYVREETALALPRGHRLTRRNSIGMSDIADESLLALPADSLPTLMAMVGSGIGLALVPSSTASIVFPNVAVRRLRDASSTNLYLTHRMDAKAGAIEAFLEVLNKERGVSPFLAYPICPA
ncbi:MAG: LysR family substrate-binding domain-containing protein [Pseudomonadota bacterium]